MITGLSFALLAGVLVGLQNIFNSKVNERAGTQATTALVLGLGFLASLTIGLAVEGGRMLQWPSQMKLWYSFSGLLGVGVVFCLVKGMKALGPTYAVSIALTAQLGCALWWDGLGWFGLAQIDFTLKQWIGAAVIVGGILVYKLGGARRKTADAADRPEEMPTGRGGRAGA